MQFVRTNGLTNPWSLCGKKEEFRMLRHALEHILDDKAEISKEEVQLLEEFFVVTIDAK